MSKKLKKSSNPTQITWSDRLLSRPYQKAYISVDGTDCPIQEPQEFNAKWYSFKINHAAVRYEIGVTLRSKRIAWIHGPFPCGAYPDLSIFRLKLKGFLKADEKVIADSGYKDTKCIIPDGLNNEKSKLHSTLRARHERLNQCFKKVKVLSQRFRHNLELHSYCFCAVANIVHATLDEHPLFEIELFDQQTWFPVTSCG